MEYVPAIAASLAAIGVIISSLALRHNRHVLHVQVMDGLMKDYRSPEMLSALNHLYRFYRDYTRGKDIKTAFDEEYERDQTALSKMEPKKSGDYESSTLNNHRRIVSQFYIRMYWLIVHGAVPAALVFSYWNSSDLDILVPKILEPIKRDPSDKLLELLEISRKERNDDDRTILHIGIAFIGAWLLLNILLILYL